MQPKSAYEIVASQSNINAYNRYPFADLAEAVHRAKSKQLQPGEMAICYYFDENSVIGVNAILAIGNLRKGGNLIFENIAPQFDRLKDDIYKDINETHSAINNNLDIINYNNRIVSEVKNDISKLKIEIDTNTVSKQQWVNLDKYDLDLTK